MLRLCWTVRRTDYGEEEDEAKIVVLAPKKMVKNNKKYEREREEVVETSRVAVRTGTEIGV